MISNQDSFHEYSGPTYSRTLSSSRDLEMTKPLLLKSYVTQPSNKVVNVSVEESFQINGYKMMNNTDPKNEMIALPLAKPPRKTTRCEIILIFICIVLAIILLIVTIIMVKCLLIQDNSAYNVIDNRILYCLTASCLRATSEITDVMGNNINNVQLACNNLEKFACGDWLENSRLPPTSVNWNLLEEVRYSHQEELRNILESNLGNISETDYKWKFQMVFEKCINRDIHTIGYGCSKGMQTDNDMDELRQMPQIKMDSLDQILQNLQVDFNVPIFFTTTLVRNYTESTNDEHQRTIVLLSDYESEGMPDFQQLQSKSEINHLKEYITECAKIAQFSSTQVEDMSEDFVAILKSLRLASFNTSKEKRNFPELKTVKINLTELTVLTKQTIDFTKYLAFFHNKRNALPVNSNVLLSSIEYFNHISKIVLETKLSKIINFIRFSVIHKYGSFVSQQFSNAKQKFMWRNTGRQHPYETWQDCIELLNSPGMAGLHQLSLKNNPNRDNIVNRIEGSIMIHIKNAMLNLVQMLSINQIEKQIILEKISNVKIVIQNLTSSSLNKYYENWIFDKNTSLLKIMQKYPTRDDVTFSLDNFVMLTSNGIATYSDLAKYIPEKNLIVISNMLLQWPFYSSDNTIPRYLEFASLGLWLAKSIADVLSFKASHFSTSGQKLKYSMNITFESLSAENMLKQFLNPNYPSQMKELISPNTVKSIITIEMLEIAYDSFQKEVVAKEHVLPHLNYSAMQLMFIRLAQNFCSKLRPEYQYWMESNDKVTGKDHLKLIMFLKSYRNIYKCDNVKFDENTD